MARNVFIVFIEDIIEEDIIEDTLLLGWGSCGVSCWQQVVSRSVVANLLFRWHGRAKWRRREPEMEVGGYDVIKQYVRLGLGFSIVMSHCLRDDDDLHATPVSRYFPKRACGVVLCKGHRLSPPAEDASRTFYILQMLDPSSMDIILHRVFQMALGNCVLVNGAAMQDFRIPISVSRGFSALMAALSLSANR